MPIDLTPWDARELQRIRRKIDTLSGPGVTNTPERVTIAGQAPAPQRAAPVATPFFFLAEITGSTTLGSTGARWKYAWREVEFDGDSYATLSGGRSGTTGAASGSDLGYALNLNEMTITTAKSGTTAWYIDGVQANSTTSGSAYPTGFGVRPIGGGGTTGTHKLNALVWMRDAIDKNGDRRFYFAAKMNHDGSCT